MKVVATVAIAARSLGCGGPGEASGDTDWAPADQGAHDQSALEDAPTMERANKFRRLMRVADKIIAC
jgi:hypothetical protein